MKNSVPACNFQSNNSFINQKNSMGLDQDFVELLWQNGQVVLNSQTQRKQVLNSVDSRQIQNNDQSTLRTSGSYRNSSNLFQQDETVSWIQYPLEDPLEQELCSNLLPELPSCEVEEADKSIKQFEEEKLHKFGAYSAPHGTSSVQKFSGNTIPSPRFHFPDSSKKNNNFSGSQKVLNFPQFSAIPKVAPTSSIEARVCSVMTVGSSHCGSNQIPRDRDVSRPSRNGVWTTSLSAEPESFRHDIQRTFSKGEKGKSETHEPTVTSSSSGGSGGSHGKIYCQSTSIHSQKRKAIDAEDLEEQSEAMEFKPAATNKAAQRTGSSRRSRAAEVHNLSERRRRDRINEKMKALQQLIPHSNKTDKASMLDEAIEYLKSLQFQLQVMWMGAGMAGMAPMMVPGIQHYMSQMGMGLATPSLPPIHNHMNIPRVPLDQSTSVAQTSNQAVTFQTPVGNFQNPMQNHALSEQYARFMGYHLMQSASQPMNTFRYGSQTAQHSQTMIPPGNSIGTLSGAANTDDAVGDKVKQRQA